MRVCPSEVYRTLPAGVHCRKNPYKPYTPTRAHARRAKYISKPGSLPPPGARRRRPQARPDGYRQTPGPRSGHRTRPDRLCGVGHGASRFRRRKRHCLPFSRSIGHAGLSFKSAHIRTPPTRTRARREALFAVFEVDWSLWSALQIRTRPHTANAHARETYGRVGQAVVERVGALAGGFQQIRRDGAPVPSEGRGRTGEEAQASVVSGRRPTRRLTALPPGPGSCRSRFLQRGARPSPGMIFPAAHHPARRMATQGLEIRNGHE